MLDKTIMSLIISRSSRSQEVLPVFDRFHLKESVLIGHSYGKLLSIYLAEERSNLITKLKLINSEGPIRVTAQRMKFSIKDFFSKCDQIRNFFTNLVTFPKDILMGKLHFFVQMVLTPQFVQLINIKTGFDDLFTTISISLPSFLA